LSCVDIDKRNILLEKPGQHNVDATYRGKENIYMFNWKGKIIA